MSQLLTLLAAKPVFPPTPVLEEDFNAANILRFEDDFFRTLGPTIFSEDFNASNITRFQDTFNRTDPAPWEEYVPSGNTIYIQNGKLVCESTGSGFGGARLSFTFDPNKWYRVATDLDLENGASTEITAANVLGNLVPAGSKGISELTATGLTNNFVRIQQRSNSANQFALSEYVLIEEVPALAGADDTSTGGSVEISDGAVLLTRGTVSERPSLTWALTVEQNTNYLLKFLVGTEGGIIQALVGTFPEGSDLLNVNGNAGGTFSLSFDSGANTTVYLTLRNSLDNSAVTLDNVTIQETLQTAPWVNDPTRPATAQIVNGALVITNDAADASTGRFSRLIETEAGKWYQYSASLLDLDATGAVIAAGSALHLTDFGVASSSSPGILVITFQASSNTSSITLQVNDFAQTFTSWDNVTIEEVPALDGAASSNVDVSVSNGELTIVKQDSISEGYITWAVPTVIGTDYLLGLDVTSLSSPAGTQLRAGSTVAGFENTFLVLTNDPPASFTATATTTYVTVRFDPTQPSGVTATFSLITVQESLLANPTFDSDTAWNKGAGWTIASGVATHDGSPGSNSLTPTNLPAFVAGIKYLCTYEVLRADAGTIRFNQVGDGVINEVPSGELGQRSVRFRSNGNNIQLVAESNFDGAVDNVIVEPEPDVQGFGGIPTKDSTDAPDYYDRGLPFDDGGLLAVDDLSPIARYHQGLPFTANGRLATNSLAPPTRFGNGGAPFGEEGRLCLNANTADHYLAAVPYNADSSVTEA